MDPNACWAGLYDAFYDGDNQAAAEQAISLAEWLDKGGFPPKMVQLAGLTPEILRGFAAVCRYL